MQIVLVITVKLIEIFIKKLSRKYMNDVITEKYDVAIVMFSDFIRLLDCGTVPYKNSYVLLWSYVLNTILIHCTKNEVFH